jgi:dihydroorotase
MVFIKSVKIVAPHSTYHGKVVDMAIENGIITQIGAKLKNDKKLPEINRKGLHLSPGFVDMNAYIGEPGLEHKETVLSASKAASAGGFTHVCVMPNVVPPTTSKAAVEFLKQKDSPFPTNLLPVGAVTQDIAGKDLADLYDMHNAGAVAFSDGIKSLPTAGILERALLYTTNIGALIMQHAEDKSLAKNGMMHEGQQSTLLGLPAMPAIAEEIGVARDLSVLGYSGGRLHFIDISLKKSVELIAKAKQQKLAVTASCNMANLFLTDKAVKNYDTTCKVNPPLREEKDRTALIKGLKEGAIDTICSQHMPQDEESTVLEFDKADFGMIAFETFFAVCNTALKDSLPLEKIIEAIAIKPRQILGLPLPAITKGAIADFTLFDPNLTWTFAKEDIKSKSKNTPFIGTAFEGKVLGTFYKHKNYLSPLIKLL